MNKFLKFDERENRIVRQVSTILYLITIYSLIGIQLYRQFILNQPLSEWNDIAILISVNVLGWIGSLVYLTGVINPLTVKIRHLVLGFTVFVAIGLVFTIFKYAVLLNQKLNLELLWDSLTTVLLVSGLITLFWGLLAFLGSKKLEKRLE